MSTLRIHLIEIRPPSVNGVRPYSRALDRPAVVAALREHFNPIFAHRDRPATITGIRIEFTDTRPQPQQHQLVVYFVHSPDHSVLRFASAWREPPGLDGTTVLRAVRASEVCKRGRNAVGDRTKVG